MRLSQKLDHALTAALLVLLLFMIARCVLRRLQEPPTVGKMTTSHLP